MKLIIAGGRKYKFTSADITLLDHIKHRITEIVHGGAAGVDTEAGIYAQIYNIPCKVFKADWDKFGKSAGHLRNRDMAIYADVVLLFPGGRGTESMRRFAIEYNLTILDYRIKGVKWDLFRIGYIIT